MPATLTVALCVIVIVSLYDVLTQPRRLSGLEHSRIVPCKAVGRLQFFPPSQVDKLSLSLQQKGYSCRLQLCSGMYAHQQGLYDTLVANEYTQCLLWGAK